MGKVIELKKQQENDGDQLTAEFMQLGERLYQVDVLNSYIGDCDLTAEEINTRLQNNILDGETYVTDSSMSAEIYSKYLCLQDSNIHYIAYTPCVSVKSTFNIFNIYHRDDSSVIAGAGKRPKMIPSTIIKSMLRILLNA